MDIDKRILLSGTILSSFRFSSLMDIDKRIHIVCDSRALVSFSSLMDIDKRIRNRHSTSQAAVLVH